MLNLIGQNTECTSTLCRRSSNTGSKSGYSQRLACALFTNILIKDLENPFHPAFTCCILQSILHKVEQIQVVVKLNGGQLKHKKKRTVPQTHKRKLVVPSILNPQRDHTSRQDCMQELTRYSPQCAAPLKTNITDPSINKTGFCKYYATVSTMHMSTAV